MYSFACLSVCCSSKSALDLQRLPETSRSFQEHCQSFEQLQKGLGALRTILGLPDASRNSHLLPRASKISSIFDELQGASRSIRCFTELLLFRIVTRIRIIINASSFAHHEYIINTSTTHHRCIDASSMHDRNIINTS